MFTLMIIINYIVPRANIVVQLLIFVSSPTSFIVSISLWLSCFSSAATSSSFPSIDVKVFLQVLHACYSNSRSLFCCLFPKSSKCLRDFFVWMHFPEHIYSTLALIARVLQSPSNPFSCCSPKLNCPIPDIALLWYVFWFSWHSEPVNSCSIRGLEIFPALRSLSPLYRPVKILLGCDCLPGFEVWSLWL